MNITTAKEFIAALRSGPYTSHGSYPVYFITKDGGSLSYKSARENALLIARSIRDGYDAQYDSPDYCNDQWWVIATEINWENNNLYCDHSNERIKSAYAEFDPAPINEEHDKG